MIGKWSIHASIMLTNRLARLRSVELGHVQIEQHQIRKRPGARARGDTASRASCTWCPRFLKSSCNQCDVEIIVLGRLRTRSGKDTSGCPSAPTTALGRVRSRFITAQIASSSSDCCTGFKR